MIKTGKKLRNALPILIALILPLVVKDSPFYSSVLIMTVVYAMLAIAWNLTAGFTGLIAFNHIALFGIGAYTTTLLQVLYGVNAWIGMLAGGLVAAVVGMAFIYPAARLKGLFMALATIAFSIAVQILFINWRIVIYTDTYPKYLGGAVGIFLPIKEESLINLQWHTTKLPYCYIAILLLMLEYFVIRKIMNSRIGYYFLAIRDDDLAAEHIGINTTRYKVLSMGIASFFSGIAGCFYAQYLLFVEPFSYMSITFMFTISLITLVGGLGTLEGPILGSIFYVPLSTLLRVMIGGTRFAPAALIILAAILIVTAIKFPEGLHGILRRIRK